MLGKLLKYECRSTARILLPLYGVILCFTVIIKLCFDFDIVMFSSSMPMMAFGFLWFLYGGVMMAIFVMTGLLIVQRFYKNLLGDEGYLMHTLPVSAWQHITSKLIIAFAWVAISSIVAIFSIGILTSGIIDILGELLYMLEEIISFNALLHILSLLIKTLASIMSVYTAIAIGHLARKNRILASFGAFLAMKTVIGITSGMIGAGIGSSTNFFSIGFSLNDYYSIALIVDSILFATYFAVTNYIVKNKLNLD